MNKRMEVSALIEEFIFDNPRWRSLQRLIFNDEGNLWRCVMYDGADLQHLINDELLKYDTDISAAMRAAEKVGMLTLHPIELDFWQAKFDEYPGGSAGEATANTAPSAICLAALKVKGVEVSA